MSVPQLSESKLFRIICNVENTPQSNEEIIKLPKQRGKDYIGAEGKRKVKFFSYHLRVSLPQSIRTIYLTDNFVQ